MTKVDRPLTILYIHHGKGIGGAPLSLLNLIKTLDRRFYHPIVLFLHASEAIEQFRQAGIDCVGPADVYDFAHTAVWWFRWRHLFHLIRAIRDTRKTASVVAPFWLRLINPDIVHLNTSSLIGWAYAAYHQNIPVVWHIREPIARGYFGVRRLMLIRIIKRYAHTILPICKNDSLPWHQQANVRVLYNCVDELLFDAARQSLEKKNSVPILLFMGGMAPAKGFDVVLEVMLRLKKLYPEVRCLIAGYCDNRYQKFYYRLLNARTRKIYRQLKELGDTIQFLGPIQDVPAVMALADILLCPFTVGHFARPIIEAGFMHAVVIASAVPPLDEIVQHGKTGFLIPVYDYDIWAATINDLLRDSEKRLEIANNAYHFCKDRFSSASYKKNIDQIYQRVRGEEL